MLSRHGTAPGPSPRRWRPGPCERTLSIGRTGVFALSTRLANLSASGNVTGWVAHDTYTGFIYTDLYRRLMDTGGATTPVGAFPTGVSGYGCHDMAGNAFEWTTTVITATNGAEKGKAVNEVRGGSWYSTGTSAKATGIGEGRAGRSGYHSVGFRLVILPPAGS